MKKSKPSKKPSRRGPPRLTAEELASGHWVEYKPTRLPPNLRAINGIELADDLDETLSDYAFDAALAIQQADIDTLNAAQGFLPEFTNIDYAEWQLRHHEANAEGLGRRFDLIYAACLEAVRQGFFAALVRYSTELAGTAEAKALAKARASAAKASAAKSGKAAPRREAIRTSIVEQTICWLKECRRIGTRFEKLAIGFLAARGQSPSVAFVHTKTSGGCGCRAADSRELRSRHLIPEVRQAVCPQPASDDEVGDDPTMPQNRVSRQNLGWSVR